MDVSVAVTSSNIAECVPRASQDMLIMDDTRTMRVVTQPYSRDNAEGWHGGWRH
jgi:hypothetical protein